jgi:hypothetical protein
MSKLGIRIARRTLIVFVASLAVLTAFGIGIAAAQSGYFTSLGIGEKPARGEQLRVRGWTVFGVAGRQGGAVTFMPPDGTGWYSIDNPGGQRLRITGGSRPGTYEYVTIRHPGHVTINGNLQVRGAITDASGRPYSGSPAGHGMPDVSKSLAGGKASAAVNLQHQIDELRVLLNELVERVNKLQ